MQLALVCADGVDMWWMWICGYGYVDMDMWIWICGYGYVDEGLACKPTIKTRMARQTCTSLWICGYVDMWIWIYGYGYGYVWTCGYEGLW